MRIALFTISMICLNVPIATLLSYSFNSGIANILSFIWCFAVGILNYMIFFEKN